MDHLLDIIHSGCIPSIDKGIDEKCIKAQIAEISEIINRTPL
jgi:hypothetical protein